MSDRLFFALWPDPATRQELLERIGDLTASIDGRMQRPDQWHVTLEFLGEVPRKRQPGLRAAANWVRPASITLEFDRLEHWRKPQVLCLAASGLPVVLATLVKQMRVALAEEGFSTEVQPLRPHVTLARKVRSAVAARLDPPLVWRSHGFALVRSVTAPAGSRYEPVEWWNHAVDGD